MVKKLTIENLAVMIKRGFDSVDKRFDDVDKRFDKIDQRMINVESDISYLKARTDEIIRTLETHEELLDEHSANLKIIHRKLDELTNSRNKKHLITYDEFTALESRISALEKKITVRTH